MTSIVLLAAAGAGWEPAALTLLERAPGLVVLKRCVDLDDLLAAASSGQADAAVVAADLPGLDATGLDLLRHHGVRAVAVVPAGPVGDAARARAARAGLTRVVAEDMLDQLPGALTSPDEPGELPEPEAPVAQPRAALRGRVVTVWGPAGAPGRTTVAASIAAELARRRLSTVLVDADPYGGAIAPMLGVLDEVSGLLSAGRLSASGDLDERFPSVLRTLGAHLGVLTGLPRADRWPELRPGLVGEIAERGRTAGYVVIDTGFSIEDDGAEALGRTSRNQLTLDALDATDELVVVGTPDPVGLSRLARALVDLRERTALPPYVVVNRMRPSLGWSEREVAAMLAGVVRVAGVRFLPDDRTSLDRAVLAGQTLLEAAPDASLARAVAGLVDEFAPPVVGRRADRSGTLRQRRAATARRR
jgi:MinD-like ATPase involved in chromosome partitioning or flagellar assembly